MAAGSLAAAGTANGIVRGCFEMQNIIHIGNES